VHVNVDVDVVVHVAGCCGCSSLENLSTTSKHGRMRI
jgi:hypothetical protein